MRLLGLCPDTFQHRHHDAENDAAMTRLIYTVLLELADGKPVVEKSYRTRDGLSRPCAMESVWGSTFTNQAPRNAIDVFGLGNFKIKLRAEAYLLDFVFFISGFVYNTNLV